MRATFILLLLHFLLTNSFYVAKLPTVFRYSLSPPRFASSLSIPSNLDSRKAISEDISSRDISPQAQINLFRRLYHRESENVSVSLLQQTTGKVPRSYLPSFLQIDIISDSISEDSICSAVEEALRWYLDASGKLTSLYVLCARPDLLNRPLQRMGFSATDGPMHDIGDLGKGPIFRATSEEVLTYAVSTAATLRQRESEGLSQRVRGLLDVQGRLYHELGQLSQAVEAYTAALLLFPNDSHILRNLGSAYHAKGSSQLAFASYQQALQVNPADSLVYLKLAFFYEDFAKKDWIDAGSHAERCYRYYLQEVDPGDTSILLRLGNLLLQEGDASAALAVYNDVIARDASSAAAWFNRAHAQLKLDEFSGAKESLQEALRRDASLIAARHMLDALDDVRARAVRKMDEKYVIQLFDQYATTYEEHGKKLLYSAPRIIRQELAKIYKQRKQAEDASFSIPDVMTPPSQSDGCTGYVSFMNNSLDILDLGCGTGLMGAWLKDYARSLVGVDLSPNMIHAAGKKMIYQELAVSSIERYLDDSTRTRHFDLIVAAEVFSYVGELTSIFSKISRFLSSGGLFAFTVESLDGVATSDEASTDFQLSRSGRFAYRKRYIMEVIAQHSQSLRLTFFREFSPRMDVGRPVPGYLFILEKQSVDADVR